PSLLLSSPALSAWTALTQTLLPWQPVLAAQAVYPFGYPGLEIALRLTLKLWIDRQSFGQFQSRGFSRPPQCAYLRPSPFRIDIVDSRRRHPAPIVDTCRQIGGIALLQIGRSLDTD